MLDFERREPAALVAAQTDESSPPRRRPRARGQSARLRAPASKSSRWTRTVAIRQPARSSAEKNAISARRRSARHRLTWARSIAARITSGFSKAWA